jgi:hypothetical protein
MGEKSSINYIFFLASEKLSPAFFELAEMFGQLNITLLPVTISELQNIDRHQRHQLIVLRDDLNSAQNFIEIKKSYLDFAMSRGHVAVYDISSFSEIENSLKYKNKRSYFYFPLPINPNEVVVGVALDYFKTKNELEEWPGGRRSKIPTANYENKN